jgi:putative ABC transport system permease protein
MFKNFLLIALRNLRRNPVFSFINVLGLAIGISASLVIYLIVSYDFSFEKFQKDKDRIYRVVTNMTFAGSSFPNSGVPMPLQTAIKTEMTGVEITAPFHQYYEPRISIVTGDTSKPAIFKKQKNIVFADNDYFRLIPHVWLAGSPSKALTDPFKVVLTETRAKQYFPGIRPTEIVGRTISYDDSVRITVSGVVKDLDEITDFTFKEFLSYSTLEKSNLKNQTGWGEWGSVSSSTQLMIKLSPGTTVEKINKQFKDLRKKYSKDNEGTSTTTHTLQPLQDIHFNSTYDNFDQRIASRSTLYGLIMLSVFLLVLGCINFINLTTAQASQRAKEIGIRKTLGSVRKQLMIQFLSETFLLTLLATIVSVLITPIILKLFKDFVPAELHFSLIRQPGIILFLLVLILVVSIFSGFYPALVLSGFKPILVLKNQAYSNTGKTRSSWLRKTLTVTQFVIAQVFVMGTFMVSKQISYSINKDLGFNKEAIIFLQTPYKAKDPDARFVMAEKLKNIPGIRMISLASSPPSSRGTMSTTMKYKDGKKEQEFDIQLKYGDTNYLRLYQLRLLAGRNLLPSDTVRELVINETFAKLIGFQNPYQAIGKEIIYNEKRLPIAGVVRDFHQKSLHETIKPLAVLSRISSSRVISIGLDAHNGSTDGWKNTIQKIEAEWKQFYPDEEFDYKFFDESIASFYEADQKISGLLNWAAGLAILISCLGLLGLLIYTTNQRTKEIGVRKVLGATVAQVVTLLSKDFVKLVLVAFVIASPIAWWAMQKWLDNFQYRTSMSWWIFAAAGLLMVVIALLTLGFQIVRSASANPVKSLRSE